MKYYLKSTFLPFLYIFFSSITAFGICELESALIKYVLLSLNLAVCILVVVVVAFKNGEQAYKDLLTNDMERREIIRTGLDRPLKLNEEYAPYKGIILGLFPCLLLIVLMFVQALLLAFGVEYEGLSAICVIIYRVIYAFFECGGVTLYGFSRFWCLLTVPVVLILTYVSYELGAKRERLVHERIKEKKNYIYGE